jgi:hypothetical protein
MSSQCSTDAYASSSHAPLLCRHCGALATPEIGPGSGPHHAAVRCQHCHKFLTWLSKYAPDDREARRQAAQRAAMAHKPASLMQLSYLHALGDAGPPPQTMLEASTRIDALLQRKEV